MCGYRWVERSGPRGHDPEHADHGIEVGLVEALAERMSKLRSAIAADWPGDATTQRIRMAAIGHPTAFSMWKTLTDDELCDPATTDLMLRVVPRSGVGHRH
jgi:hypothetical protein